MTKKIWALPGFLGLPSDWDFFNCPLFKGVDLNSETWLEQLPDSDVILMGYSFGGRLALQTLLQHPQRFKSAIIISAHPGLFTEAERLERLRMDEEWAQRFENEDWTALIDSWNSRAVFLQDGFHFKRNEADYDRKQLADLLRWGSLGRQRDLRSEIGKLEMPILWVTGEKDIRYTQLAREVSFLNPRSKLVVMSGTGHRCPWEKPKEFVQLIQDFKVN